MKAIISRLMHHATNADRPISKLIAPSNFALKPAPIINSAATLKIPVIASKCCPGDCVYCPYGRTTCQTLDRSSFFPVEELLNKIQIACSQNTSIKQIEITGQGEPTLNADIGQIINYIKCKFSVPVTVNTCGSLFWRESVQRDLFKADVVFANVDAADKSVYQAVNRYHLQIPFSRYIDGLMKYRLHHHGFYVRVALVQGVNTQEDHIRRLATLVNELSPDAVFVEAYSSTQEGHIVPADPDASWAQYLASYFNNNIDSQNAYVPHSKEL